MLVVISHQSPFISCVVALEVLLRLRRLPVRIVVIEMGVDSQGRWCGACIDPANRLGQVMSRHSSVLTPTQFAWTEPGKSPVINHGVAILYHAGLLARQMRIRLVASGRVVFTTLRGNFDQLLEQIVPNNERFVVVEFEETPPHRSAVVWKSFRVQGPPDGPTEAVWVTPYGRELQHSWCASDRFDTLRLQYRLHPREQETTARDINLGLALAELTAKSLTLLELRAVL
jgi:hypothetical protein